MENIIVWQDLCGSNTTYDDFWSDVLTVDTNTPDLTDCFQKTVLTWIPCGCLFICMTYWIPYLASLPTVHEWKQTSLINLIKVTTGFIMIVVLTVQVYWAVTGYVTFSDTSVEVYPADYLSPIFKATFVVLATAISREEYNKGLHTSGPMFVYWTLSLLCEIVTVRSYMLRATDWGGISKIGPFALYYAFFTLVVVQFLCQLLADTGAFEKWERKQADTFHLQVDRKADESKSLLDKESFGPEFMADVKPIPEQYSNFLMRRLFLWITRDVIKGWRKPVTFQDLYNLRPKDRCKSLIESFYFYYYGTTDTSARFRVRKQGTLFWAIFQSSARNLLLAYIIQITSTVFQMIAPQILRVMLRYFDAADEYNWKGIMLAACMFAVSFIRSILVHNYLFYAWTSSMRVRSVLNSIVYRKTLRLAGAAKKKKVPTATLR